MRRKLRQMAWMACGVTIACFVALWKMRLGGMAAVALADALTVSGCLLCLPWSLIWLWQREGADGLAYASSRMVDGLLPVGKKCENYRDYKRRRQAGRTQGLRDAFPLWLGGTLGAFGVVLSWWVI